ncbi:MAG: SRPBCC domain-containing protein [Bacteroidetes bacterium]|nr:SRPBCC domain-containing protein [Bacteroidota bacterium]
MAKEIKTQIVINASAEKIWSILTDFNSYSKWNPFIISLTGNVSGGNTIAATLKAPGAKAMTVKPKVLTFNRNKEFKWVGHLLMPGIFTGEHKFEIIDNGNKTCTFVQSEKFTGILIPLFTKMLDGSTTEGFKLMNEALKKTAEL